MSIRCIWSHRWLSMSFRIAVKTGFILNLCQIRSTMQHVSPFTIYYSWKSWAHFSTGQQVQYKILKELQKFDRWRKISEINLSVYGKSSKMSAGIIKDIISKLLQKFLQEIEILLCPETYRYSKRDCSEIFLRISKIIILRIGCSRNRQQYSVHFR